MSPTAGKQIALTAKRIVDVEFLSAKQIADTIGSSSDFPTEDVTVSGKPVTFTLEYSDDDFELAKNLHLALLQVRQASPGLLNDHGFWTWIALYPLRDHVVRRWCDGYEDGRPKKESGCNYFLTGDGVHAQSRCAPRRLFIAAHTSKTGGGDYSKIPLILKTSDIFSAVFERKLGLDPEIALEMFIQFEETKADRKTYRHAIKLVGLILATICLEDLDSTEKAQIVRDALDEVSETIIESE